MTIVDLAARKLRALTAKLDAPREDIAEIDFHPDLFTGDSQLAEIEARQRVSRRRHIRSLCNTLRDAGMNVSIVESINQIFRDFATDAVFAELRYQRLAERVAQLEQRST